MERVNPLLDKQQAMLSSQIDAFNPERMMITDWLDGEKSRPQSTTTEAAQDFPLTSHLERSTISASDRSDSVILKPKADVIDPDKENRHANYLNTELNSKTDANVVSDENPLGINKPTKHALCVETTNIRSQNYPSYLSFNYKNKYDRVASKLRIDGSVRGFYGTPHRKMNAQDLPAVDDNGSNEPEGFHMLSPTSNGIQLQKPFLMPPIVSSAQLFTTKFRRPLNPSVAIVPPKQRSDFMEQEQQKKQGDNIVVFVRPDKVAYIKSTVSIVLLMCLFFCGVALSFIVDLSFKPRFSPQIYPELHAAEVAYVRKELAHDELDQMVKIQHRLPMRMQVANLDFPAEIISLGRLGSQTKLHYPSKTGVSPTALGSLLGRPWKTFWSNLRRWVQTALAHWKAPLISRSESSAAVECGSCK